MATAKEGGPTDTTNNTTNSSYGGGAGGKFRKKPFRRQTTPYDRPPAVLRANSNESNVSWLTKLVVDPASKLISYGAHRFFGSILQRHLPPPTPPPTQAPEVNHDLSGGFQGAAPTELMIRESSHQELKVSESSRQELKVKGTSQLINNSNSDGISELEQFLKQNTFTRSEIDHLTELLHSRAVEEREKKEAASVFVRHEKFSGGLSDENSNKGIRFHGATETPISKSKVLEDDIGSPAELAKAYMGSRPSKVSPSMLGTNSHREDTRLLNNTPFTLKSPIVPYTRKSSGCLGATENGFITPRSRGRTAIYNMARTPYSRVHQTCILKGGGLNSNNFGQPTPSSSLPLSENGGKFESKSTTLKRRSSFLDDEVGSVGPMRRIRHKHNLLAPRVPHSAHGAEIGSAGQKLSLIGQGNRELSKAAVENENGSMPSTSYASVPSKSSEVASRILHHLEKLSPKEKSLTSKSVTVQDKSPFKLAPGMLPGQALSSIEDVGTSKFMLDVQDEFKMEDRSKANLPDASVSTSQKYEKVEESRGKESVAPPVSGSPAKNNNFEVPLIISGPSTGKADSLVRNGASQPPQKKRAFRMSAQEDSFEQEDDIHNNRVMLRPLSESKGPMEVPLMERKLSTSEEMVKTTIQSEVKSTSGFELSKTSDFGVPGSGKFGETSGGIAISTSEVVNKASQSAVLPPPATAFDNPKDNPPLFSFGSKVNDKFPPLPSKSSSKMSEPKLDSSSSFINTSAPNGSQLKTPESQNGDLDPVKAAADKFGKSDTSFPATNGPTFGSQPSAFSFNAASSNNTNQVSTGAGFVSTVSTNIASFASTGTGTTTSAASTGSIFGSTVAPAAAAESVFKFGSSTPSTANNRSELADAIKQSFGSSNPSVVSFSSPSSGSSIFGLTPSTGNSGTFNPQSSMFNSASKSTASGNETAPQSSSVQPASSTSLPPFTTTTSTPFGSSFSNSQPFNSKPPFSLSSSSDTNSIAPVSGPTPALAKFGASSTAASDNNAVTPNSNSSPGIFTFGLASSSTSTNTMGSSTAATSAPFIFGSSSSTSFGSGTSGVFNFGGSSTSSASSSAAASSTTSSSAPNIFGSSFQSSPIFGSTFASSSSPSTGFAFGGSSTPAAPTNTAPSIFSTPSGSASTPNFSFTASCAPAIPFQSGPAGGSSSSMFQFSGAPATALSTQSSQPVFGAPASGFGAFLGNNNQMNAEDSMAEDPVQSTAPVFGQPGVSPSPPGAFMFGQTAPPVQQANLFQFGGQSSGIGSANPNPFQASTSLEFNTGGSFSLGSGGGDKSGRRTVRVSRNRNRKK